MFKHPLFKSKKAVFLLLALIQLNVILAAAVVWKVAAGEFLNALTVLASFYFASEGSIDVARAIKAKSGAAVEVKEKEAGD